MTLGEQLHMDVRVFKVWEYQVSHGQLLIRSPKSPATADAPERLTNVDVVLIDVEYMALPRVLRGIEFVEASLEELRQLASILGRSVRTEEVRVLVSEGRRHPVVAMSLSISENDWDIFDSPFEFRSHFRGATR